ncbi:MAG: ArsC/Spx/MgsR family protein [Luteibaculaceae bacterium]
MADKKFTIWHNPRCRKSREALALLNEKTAADNIAVVHYLEENISEAEYGKMLKKLNCTVDETLRKNEALFKEKFRGKNFEPHEWITILLENRELIERPIVMTNSAAIIGRDLEKLEAFLEKYV